MKKLFFLFAMAKMALFAMAQAPSGVEMVDLGLPSGIKWANMNVGATTAEGYGLYFAWGETEPKIDYSWDTYMYCNGTYNSLTKYCTSSGYGTIDNKTILDLEDDAAHVNWGDNWRMPTDAEWTELLTNCAWAWTTVNGVNGYRVEGSNGNSIFIPAAGYCDIMHNYDVGSCGNYWSSSLESYNSNAAYFFFFNSSRVSSYNYYSRFFGQSIRAVCDGPTPEPEYTRSTTAGSYGTICLPKAVASANVTDAKIFNVAFVLKNNNDEITHLVMEEETGNLVAGKPYIFRALADEISFEYTGEAVNAPISAVGLVGNLEENALDVPQGKYVISNNQIRKLAGGSATVGQNRAYIDLDGVTAYTLMPTAAPNRVVMPVEDNHPVATNIENMTAHKATKVFRDGKILIQRDSKTYDLIGRPIR